jgi:hypothetical protein
MLLGCVQRAVSPGRLYRIETVQQQLPKLIGFIHVDPVACALEHPRLCQPTRTLRPHKAVELGMRESGTRGFT